MINGLKEYRAVGLIRIDKAVDEQKQRTSARLLIWLSGSDAMFADFARENVRTVMDGSSRSPDGTWFFPVSHEVKMGSLT